MSVVLLYCTVVLYASPPSRGRLTTDLRIKYDCVCYVCYDRPRRKTMSTWKGTIFCFIWLIHLLLFLFSDKSIILLLTELHLSFPLHILTIYHKAPTSQDSFAQRGEDEINASPRLDTHQYLVGRWKASSRGLSGRKHVVFPVCLG